MWHRPTSREWPEARQAMRRPGAAFRAATGGGFLFFEATEWEGEPVNREPGKCLELRWFGVREPPDDIIEYPKAGLLGYLAGSGGPAEHGW